MNGRRNEIQVGLFAVIGLLLLAMLILVFGGFKNVLANTYTITALFPNAAGTTQNTPVRLLGIEIGRVKDIKLSPGANGVVMTLEIQGDVDVGADAAISIKQEGFIANIYLEFGPGSTKEVLPKNGSAQVEGKVETFAVFIETASTTLSQQVSAVSQKLMALADNLTDLAGDEAFRQNVKDLAANTSIVTSQLKERLPDMIDSLTASAKKAEESLDKASVLFDTYQTLGGEFQQTNAALRTEIVKQGANLDELSKAATEAAENLSKMASDVAEITEMVKNGQGSAGKLVTDDDLYRSLVSLMDTLTAAVQEFKETATILKEHPEWFLKGRPAKGR